MAIRRAPRSIDTIKNKKLRGVGAKRAFNGDGSDSSAASCFVLLDLPLPFVIAGKDMMCPWTKCIKIVKPGKATKAASKISFRRCISCAN